MYKVTLHNFKGDALESAHLNAYDTLADNFIRIWPEGFEGFTPLVQDSDGLVLDPATCCHTQPRCDYHLVLMPQGPALLGIPLGMWILAAVSIAAAVLLAPSVPNVSGGDYEWEDGDSNFAANQDNKVRPGARVPDIYGKMRVYPDLIANPYSRYFGREQHLFELFVIGEGEYELSELKLHEDNLLETYGIEADIIPPGGLIPSRFRIVTPNQSLSNQELPAENESYSSTTLGLDFDNASSTIAAPEAIWGEAVDAGMILIENSLQADNNRVFTVTGYTTGTQQLSIDVTPAPTDQLADGGAVYYPVTGPNGQPYSAPRSGDKRMSETLPAGSATPTWFSVLSKNDVIVLDENPPKVTRVKSKNAFYNQAASNQVPYQHDIYSIDIENSAAGSGTIDFFRAEGDGLSTPPDDEADGYRNWSPWFVTPNDDAVDLWFDYEFPRGLYYQEAGKTPVERSVRLDYQYRLVGTTAATGGSHTYTERTRNVLRFSERVRNLTPGQYEMRWRRHTDFEPETSTKLTIDECKVFRFAGARQPRDRSLGSNVTAVMLEIPTQLQNFEGGRKFNCVASRKLPTYASGVPVGLQETSSIADAVAHTLIDRAGYSAADIDLDDLYARFSGNTQTFDGVIDQEMSADDQISMMLACGNGYAYRRAGAIYFARDRNQSIPVALFNRRNKIAPERKSMSFALGDEPDGVEVTFFDEDQNYKQQVVAYPGTGNAVRPKKITVIGTTSWNKAWRRARREYDLIRYRRDTLQMSVTEEGALLGPGQLVAVTDSLRESLPLEGEVLGASAKSVICDVDVGTAQPGDLVRLRDKTGAVVQETTVQTVSGTSMLVNENVTVTESLDPSASVKILFEVVPQTQGPQELWLVQTVTPNQDGSVDLECVNYADQVYDADDATPPPHPNG